MGTRFDSQRQSVRFQLCDERKRAGRGQVNNVTLDVPYRQQHITQQFIFKADAKIRQRLQGLQIALTCAFGTYDLSSRQPEIPFRWVLFVERYDRRKGHPWPTSHPHRSPLPHETGRIIYLIVKVVQSKVGLYWGGTDELTAKIFPVPLSSARARSTCSSLTLGKSSIPL